MSTRGAIGFVINGTTLAAYNHSDSYPSWLGVEVLADCKQLAKLTPAILRRKVKALKVINKNIPPTETDIAKLAPWTNLSVSQQSTSDWYCLTQNAQGSLLQTFRCGYITDNANFLKDSLFCEYAYILNVDTRQLECYVGFNKDPKAAGRYANSSSGGTNEYYGVRLVATYPLGRLPSEARFLDGFPTG